MKANLLVYAGIAAGAYWWLFLRQGGTLPEPAPIAPVPRPGPPPPPAALPGAEHEGHFVIAGDRVTIYRIELGRRRRVPDWWTFLELGGMRDLSNVWPDDGVLSRVLEGPPMPIRRPAWFADGTWVKPAGSDPTIYRMEGGRKRRVPDWATFVTMSDTNDWRSVVTLVLDGDLAQVPNGAALPSLARPYNFLFGG